jgi:phosphopantetheine--protein transferase-like protein
VRSEREAREEAESRLAAIEAEHGTQYEEGVRSVFTASKVRSFRSYWNWAATDLIEALYAPHEAPEGASDAVGHALAESLANRCTSQLVRIAATAAALGVPAASGVVPLLRARHMKQPVFRPSFQPTRPAIEVLAGGKPTAREVPREGETCVADYAAAVARPVPGAGASATPMISVRTLSEEDSARLDVSTAATAALLGALRKAAEEGITFQGKTALVTGCGRGSIGAQIVAALLRGGARVVATTSRLNRRSARAFQALYEEHGARGAALTLVPFNQASRVDVDALVSHVYDSLGLDLDFVLPFAAINEAGRTLSTLDDKAELAHRIMLTNTLRLLGAVVEAKRARGIVTRPAFAVLPLSPNHGVFGGDGLYAESKLGLESLMRKWSAEGWDAYLSIAGASIGWTRGTGLMSDNDVVAAGVEERGCRTFSQAEMALNIVAMMAPPLVRIAGEAPVWADLRGGMHTLRDLKGSVDGIRDGIRTQAAVAKAVALDAQLDGPAGGSAAASGAAETESVHQRSNWTGANFPPLPVPAPAGASPLPVGMVDLDRTVVVVGFGELGPWGSSRTRWEMECFGQLSLEGVIELAWLTGKIRFHNGPLDPQSATKASWTVSEAERRAYIGWADAESGAPVRDWEVKARYEEGILEHSGVRVIEPELFDGYDPHKKRLLRQVAMGRDLPWVEISNPAEAEEYRKEAGVERVQVRKRPEDGAWEMRLLAGASISVARALKFDRWVAGQIPTGWDPKRCGVPSDLTGRVDRVTLFALVSAAEALISSGLTDPYELYSYCHVSEVGSTVGGGMGGMMSIRQVFRDRFMEGEMASDALQETFINTTAAWINMLLLSSAGPIKTVVGACATAAESADVAVETIQAGRAKVVLCGGTDDFGEEGSFEFASMGATSSSAKETSMAREPSEMSRPMAASRGGFMESQGAGIQVLMQARLALALGAPIHAVIALTSTATDKEGRSVPAPGQGILTTAREAPLPGAPAAASIRRAQAAGLAKDHAPPGAASAAASASVAEDHAAAAVAAPSEEDDGRSVASTLREDDDEDEEGGRARGGDSSADADEAALLARIAGAGDGEDATASAWTELTELRLARHHPHLSMRYRKHRLQADLRLAAAQEAEAANALDEEEARVRGSAASSAPSAHSVLVSITARRAAVREEARSAVSSAMRRWCFDVCSTSPHVSPLRAALARWGLTADDIAVASFHGTGTKANDVNESEVTNSQMEALGRTAGKPVLVVAQKGLTGHPKGAAAAWMLNGLMQCMSGGRVPGTRNLDDVEPKLRAFHHLAYPNRTITLRSTRPGLPAVPAALMKSFGFGQAGAEILLVHPDLLLRALPAAELEAYSQRRGQREAASYRYYQDVLLDRKPLIAVKSAPPFADHDEKATYLDSMARATQDPVTGEWQIRPGEAARQAGEEGLLGAVHGKAWVGPVSASEALVWLGASAPRQTEEEAAQEGVATAESSASSAASAAAASSQSAPPRAPKSLLARRADAVGDSAGATAIAVEQRLEEGAGSLPAGSKIFIGVDVEPVTTLAAAPESMLSRNFTAAERALCSSRPDPVASLAGRWAAKEAVFKALSACPGGPKSKGAGAALAEVEVLGAENSAPKVSLHGSLDAAAKAARVVSVHVSISHAAGIAVAQAVVTTA